MDQRWSHFTVTSFMPGAELFIASNLRNSHGVARSSKLIMTMCAGPLHKI